MTDIPSFRKGRLIHIAEALGFPDDAAAMRARLAAGQEFDPEFVQPIQARLDASLAQTAVREAAAAEQAAEFAAQVEARAAALVADAPVDLTVL